MIPGSLGGLSGDSIRQDVRYALRTLRKTPGFAIVTVLTLAIAIGANSSIFTLVDVLLLRKLPVRAPDELVQISLLTTAGDRAGLSLPLFEEIERRQQVFARAMVYVGGGAVAVQAGNGFRVANIWAVDGSFHQELGQTSVIGRLLTPADVNLATGQSSPVAVLGYRYWVRQFAASPDALGREIRIEGIPFTVVGVTKAGFGGLGLGEDPEVTIPLYGLGLVLRNSVGRPYDLRDRRLTLTVAARLKDGVTVEQARAHLESIRPAILEASVPDGYTPSQRAGFLARHFDVRSAATGIEVSLRARFTQPLLILLSSAGVILLVACVHLASLMLARVAGRSREIGLKLSLGAPRWRVAREILIEGFLLSISGAAVGLLFARWSSQMLADFMTRQYSIAPRFDFAPGASVLGVTAGLAIATGILFSLAPIWFTTRGDPAATLRPHARDQSGSIGPIGRTLIVVQVALSIAVMTVAVLLVRSVENARSTDAGFRKAGVLIAGLRSLPGGYGQFDPNVYYRNLIDQVRQIPGVRAASISKERPANFFPQTDTVWPILTGKSERDALAIVRFTTTPGFFDVLSIPLAHGRDFAWTDDDKRPRVVVLSRGLALRLFGRVDSVGLYVRLGTEAAQPAEVVGVVDDVRMFDLRQPPPFIVYVPSMERPQLFLGGMLEIRSDGNLRTSQSVIAHAIEVLGREYATRIQTLDEVIDSGLIAERLSARLTGFFACVVLALAAIGLFALMSYVTTRRTHEMGVRLALGADSRRLQLAVVTESVRIVAVGVVLGVPSAIAAARVIASRFVGLSPHDPLTLVAVSVTLLMVGAAAAYVPARRASRVDPITALRSE
jgi:predicted permease